MAKNIHAENEKPIVEKDNEDIDYMSLGIAQEQEADRYKIGETKETLEPLRITHVRFDVKTRYYDAHTQTGTPIVKINGINMQDEPVKLLSMSDVLYKSMQELIEVCKATKMFDDNNIEWYVFRPRVRINGFELVKTEKGKNPYVKIKTTP